MGVAVRTLRTEGLLTPALLRGCVVGPTMPIARSRSRGHRLDQVLRSAPRLDSCTPKVKTPRPGQERLCAHPAAELAFPPADAPTAGDSLTVERRTEALDALGLILVGSVDGDDVRFVVRSAGSSGFLSRSPDVDFDEAALGQLERAFEQLAKAGPGLEKPMQDATGAKLVVAWQEDGVETGGDAAAARFVVTKGSHGMFTQPTTITIRATEVAGWTALRKGFGELVRETKAKLVAACGKGG